MILTKDDALLRLRERGIVFEQDEHDAVFTTSEAASLARQLPGAACKNLFLRDKKKAHYFMLVAPAQKRTDLAALSIAIGQGRLTFGSEGDMTAFLGVTPGSVTPLALLNDVSGKVSLLIDSDLQADSHIVVHPLVNTASVSLALADLTALLGDHAHPARFMDLPGDYNA